MPLERASEGTGGKELRLLVHVPRKTRQVRVAVNFEESYSPGTYQVTRMAGMRTPDPSGARFDQDRPAHDLFLNEGDQR
jgi:hypothetical protein